MENESFKSMRLEAFDITSQNYFEELGERLGSDIEPVTRQSVSEARQKLRWEGFEALLGVANQEERLSQDRFRYQGHITRAVDGTSMLVLRTEALLNFFTPRKSKKGDGQYPSLLAVKNLLKIERFHARNFNGVMQEIFANLLVLSLTALVWSATISYHGMNRRKIVPNFKNASEVVRRHLFDAFDHGITGHGAKKLAKRLIEQTARVLWKKQPGRSYPRVSMQPIKIWNLAKSKKLADVAEGKKRHSEKQ